MFTLTIDWCRDTLYEIVKEHGADFRYQPPGNDPVCVNHYDGKPSCIIGHLLYRLGVPIDHMVNGSCGSTIASLASRGIIANPDPVVVDYLGIVQTKQDFRDSSLGPGGTKHTWGAALAAGDEFLRTRNLLST